MYFLQVYLLFTEISYSKLKFGPLSESINLFTQIWPIQLKKCDGITFFCVTELHSYHYFHTYMMVYVVTIVTSFDTLPLYKISYHNCNAITYNLCDEVTLSFKHLIVFFIYITQILQNKRHECTKVSVTESHCCYYFIYDNLHRDHLLLI